MEAAARNVPRLADKQSLEPSQVERTQAIKEWANSISTKQKLSRGVALLRISSKDSRTKRRVRTTSSIDGLVAARALFLR